VNSIRERNLLWASGATRLGAAGSPGLSPMACDISTSSSCSTCVVPSKYFCACAESFARTTSVNSAWLMTSALCTSDVSVSSVP